MGNNSSLQNAIKAKNDEFYTQYADIEKEINAYLEYNKYVFKDKTILLPCDDPEWSNFTKYFVANFKRLGIKKLISTSYAKSSGTKKVTEFEKNSPNFDEEKNEICGKVFTLDNDSSKENMDFEDITFSYLKGDGDFRSDEVKMLRDEADIIITNPPFSLFREFLAWIMEANKKFIIIGNKNAITYKEVFPLIKENKIWLGYRNVNSDMWFIVPDDHQCEKVVDGLRVKHIMGCWFTNLDHGKRHEKQKFMTTANNLKYNKKLINKLSNDFKRNTYPKYDNYNAIEIPICDAVPSDYDGVMGVPITFMDKYNPEQFEIVGATESEGKGFSMGLWDEKSKVAQPLINGSKVYKRIFIKRKEEKTNDESNT